MKQLAIDTNLLVLLIVGLTSRDFIEKHKRTRTYSPEDFDLLIGFVQRASALVVTPHVLSETSNLARQFGRPGKDQIGAVLKKFIERCDELFDRSVEVAAHSSFVRLGHVLTKSIVFGVSW